MDDKWTSSHSPLISLTKAYIIGCSCNWRVGPFVLDSEEEYMEHLKGVFSATEPLPGYHLAKITKGALGELSKIQEELDELKDAETQGIKIMQLVEASDLLGALEKWLEVKHPGTTLKDLIDMHNVTRRAFESGERQ